MTNQEYANHLHETLTDDQLIQWAIDARKYDWYAKQSPPDPEDFRDEAADDVEYWRERARTDKGCREFHESQLT